MPYFIGRLLELPLTTTQDYSLFHILEDYSFRLWEEQIERILARHGLLSFNIHPYYEMQSHTLPIYRALLSRLASLRAHHNLWAVLPREVNLWWRQRSQMELVCDGGRWRIVGEGSERATVAYAAIKSDRLVIASNKMSLRPSFFPTPSSPAEPDAHKDEAARHRNTLRICTIAYGFCESDSRILTI